MDAERQFHKGAKVRLIVGGPVMVVKDSGLVGLIESAEISCLWFLGKKLQRGSFPPETLVLVKDDAEEK